MKNILEVCIYSQTEFIQFLLEISSCPSVLIPCDFWAPVAYQEVERTMLQMYLCYFKFFIYFIQITLFHLCYIPTAAFPPSSSPSLHLPLLPIHSPFISSQKGPGFPWISTNHSVSSCGRIKLLPTYQAGQINPAWGTGYQSQLSTRDRNWSHC